MKKFAYQIFCGSILGISGLSPGISGSVVALILGVYKDIISIISNPFKNLKENIRYMTPLAIGLGIGVAVFFLGFEKLITSYPKATYLFFVGLMVGNLPVIRDEIVKNGFKKIHLVGGVTAFLIALEFGLKSKFGGNASGIGEISIVMSDLAYWHLALAGLAVGAVVLVPGISMSTIMLLLGILEPLTRTMNSLLKSMSFADLPRLGVFGVCVVVGVALSSKGIKRVFEKLPALANTTVFGFVVGTALGILVQSLRIDDGNFTWLMGGTTLAAGLGIAALFVFLSRITGAKKA